MKASKMTMTITAVMGLLVGAATLSGTSAIREEALTTELGSLVRDGVYMASKPQADRWGLFVGEWTPTFFAQTN